MRDERAVPGLVVVRLGARTLDDETLRRSVVECRERWGLWGFSVLEVPDGDYERLAQLRPIVADRRLVLVADYSHAMASFVYDLWFDAACFDADLVVETWISHGPRSSDVDFDPQTGDWVLVGDEEEPPRRAVVIRRDGNRVWVHIELDNPIRSTIGTLTDRR
ncbi:MAG: hypothetical protein ACKPDI_09560 [Actinomycetota bacterium]